MASLKTIIVLFMRTLFNILRHLVWRGVNSLYYKYNNHESLCIGNSMLSTTRKNNIIYFRLVPTPLFIDIRSVLSMETKP